MYMEVTLYIDLCKLIIIIGNENVEPSEYTAYAIFSK